MKRSIIVLLIIISLVTITGCSKTKKDSSSKKNEQIEEKLTFTREEKEGNATYKVPEKTTKYGSFKDLGVNVSISVENYSVETNAKNYDKYYKEDKEINGYKYKYYIDDSNKQFYNTYIYKYALDENDRYIIKYTPYSTKYDLNQIEAFISTFEFKKQDPTVENNAN